VVSLREDVTDSIGTCEEPVVDIPHGRDFLVLIEIEREDACGDDVEQYHKEKSFYLEGQPPFYLWPFAFTMLLRHCNADPFTFFHHNTISHTIGQLHPFS